MVRTRSTNYSPLLVNGEVGQRESIMDKVTKRHTIHEHLNGNGNGNDSDQKKNHALPSDDSKTHPTVYLVFFSLLLDLLAFTMILPLLPSLLEYYEENDKFGLYTWVLDKVKYFQVAVGAPVRFNSVLFGGVLGSMYSFLQFIVSPIIGALSDVYGRKPLMLLCLVGISFSYLLWAFSCNFGLFVLARFIGGLSKGNVSLSMAIISDVSSNKNRGKGMALVGIAFSLGFIMGPIIGAMFSLMVDKSSESWFFYPATFALLLSIADLIFITLCYKETLPKEKRAPEIGLSLSRAMEFISIGALFNFKAVQNISQKDSKKLKRLGHVYFVYLFIYSGLEFTLTFLTHHTFNYTSMQQGKMFLVIGVVMALLQGGVVRRLPQHKMLRGAELGLWIIPFSFLFVALASTQTVFAAKFLDSIYYLWIGLILFAISTAFVVSCLTSLVSQIGSPDQRGIILGVFRSLGALARASGPIVASSAFWSFGAFSTYLLGAVFLLYPVLLLRLSKLNL